MRVLVTWGTKRGGTEGLARSIAEELGKAGFEVTAEPASIALRPAGFDAAIIGGALYANRWHAAARHFVSRNVAALRRMPVWLFSSGPLDATADEGAIGPTEQVAVLMERIGALGHETFGGRLTADAKGFPASAMAKKHAGDWRNPNQIRAWAAGVAKALPTASPGIATEPKARSLARWGAYAAAGGALCAVVLGALMRLATPGLAVAVHAVAAPLIFLAITNRYFLPRGAREALPTAACFTATTALFELVAGGLLMHSLRLFTSIAGTWLPLASIFVVTWVTGWIRSMKPFPKAKPPHPPAEHALGT